MKTIKGVIYVEGEQSMKVLVDVLTRNDYAVQVKWIDGVDAFSMEYKITYKRKGHEEC